MTAPNTPTPFDSEAFLMSDESLPSRINTPTPELIERLRKEIPYNADGFSELRDLADEAAAAIAKLTAERDDYKLKYNHECNRHDLTQKRVQQLDADRVAIVEANKLLSERVAVHSRTPHMDKHKALIEKVARAIADQNGDQWEFVPEDKPDWIDNRGMFQGRSRDINEPFRCDYEEMATAALNAVYEALKEPSDEMLRVPLGQTTGPDVSFNGELLSRDRFESRRDLRPTIWKAMLSASALSSPLGKGE